MRPWKIWLAFSGCFAVVLAALAWVSSVAVRLDRTEAQALLQADHEADIRLALWRMDSALAPVIAQENARPYFAYSPFYPTEKAYTRMFAEFKRGDVLVPSPLLNQVQPHIRIHFQSGPSGEISSPQVPAGNMRDLAETCCATPEQIEEAASLLKELERRVPREALQTLGACAPVTSPSSKVDWNLDKDLEPQSAQAQVLRSGNEYVSRLENYQKVAEQQAAMPKKSAPQSSVSKAPDTSTRDCITVDASRKPELEGLMQPHWIGDTLILIRQVSVNGSGYIQGCWLDWPELKSWLLEGIQDLLPQADLLPAPAESSGGNRARMLASLPILLLPGEAPAAVVEWLTPIRVSLLIAWGCVLLAGAAITALLIGTLSLSERRGAFVSAVTHELRTPLTTFRLYTEMLEKGMVPSEEKRSQYLNTLHREANRLGHLVENVLAYARLERGRAKSQVKALAVKALAGRIKPRLTERAEQAGLRLAIEASESVLDTPVRVDVASIEQILFNLVDNACKYANTGELSPLHLEIDLQGSLLRFRVRDHGPGISRREARRLFRPFSKSAREAAHTAPGVGLGLALCRRLARSLGGDLRLEDAAGEGACFSLTVPLPKRR
ncbi:MAG: HAMP domain-containing histidine kinase [Planctomycetes bacterium]|nr:HAMP domain-containing histidine kinase [Planctomycetota bacterium]